MNYRKFLLTYVLFLLSISAFSQEKITIVKVNFDSPPFEFYDKGKPAGFHIELIESVAKNLNISIEWLDVPWSRALKMVELGDADAITFLGKTSVRENWAIFLPDNVISATEFCFIIRKEDQKKYTLTNNLKLFLNDETLLVVKDFILPPEILKIKPSLMFAPSYQNLIKMIEGKRANIGLISKNEFINLCKLEKECSKLILLEPPVAKFDNYLAFSKAKNHTELATRFAQEMRRFKKTEEFRVLQKKYLKL
ncbi:MAG: transporter substrate-binding domain-containing protein [Spirochaetales bacterium]|nr:transporter substrate-binding domain-containing protein [Spirochaetales bacterium]